jgi:DNA-directed RNA polymerase specialized sigma24 family protein
VSVERRITAKALRDVEAAYKAASKRHEEARSARNDVVRRAADEGWSYEEISEAIGLSRSRVGQIAAQSTTPKRRGRRRG